MHERKTTKQMPSETITQGLRKYSIGSKLRRLRLRKGMGLIELGRHTGLSPAMLSKLERELMHPTLPTLLRIAMVFDVGLDHFFNSEAAPVFEVSRGSDRLRFPESPDRKPPAYYFESLDFSVPNRKLNSYLANFETLDPEQVMKHSHPGVELIYVISGRLELSTSEDQHELSEGDAVYFDSSVPHGYRKLGEELTEAIVVSLGPASA